MSIVKLNDAEISQLQISLGNSNLSITSLPLRQQMWYIQEKIITNGHVYVDQWPDYKNICSLHTSEEFMNDQLDFDVVTFFSKSNYDNTFERFISALASERKWTSSRSSYGSFIPSPAFEHFKKILNGHGYMDSHGPFKMYSALEKENLEKYKNRFKQLQTSLPQELQQDILRSIDIEKVIQTWPYAPPSVSPHYFRWLLATFPSNCLREVSTNEPVAWALSYGCGSMGHLFIDEQYRGTGLSEYLWLSIGLKLADFSPLQPYFDIAPGNIPSEKSSAKTFQFDHKEDKEMVIWFFFHSKEQFPEMQIL